MNASLHQPNNVEAETVDGFAWLTISNDSGHIVIHMPYPVAKAMADAWEKATQEKPE